MLVGDVNRFDVVRMLIISSMVSGNSLSKREV